MISIMIRLISFVFPAVLDPGAGPEGAPNHFECSAEGLLLYNRPVGGIVDTSFYHPVLLMSSKLT